jgi:hypothetical protein
VEEIPLLTLLLEVVAEETSVVVAVDVVKAVATPKAVVAVAFKTPTSRALLTSSFAGFARRGVMKPLIVGTVMMKITSKRQQDQQALALELTQIGTQIVVLVIISQASWRS